MFEGLLAEFESHPYLGTAIVFVLCGLGLPLPEEIVLLAAGFLCAQKPDEISLPLMMTSCATAILVGDLLPFLGGRVFGVRLLRLRWMRYFITRQRLASFDRWFRRRGDMVIIIARFLAGLRVVAFFTAGTMKMPWRRFLFLDGLGIVLLVPILVWLGFHGAPFIKTMIQTVQEVERGILWTAAGVAVLGSLWWWLRRRRQGLLAQANRPTESFVQPKVPVQEPPVCPDPETETPETAATDATSATAADAEPAPGAETSPPTAPNPPATPPASDSPPSAS
jgi:membrane protein DedA with SNARE-associated domain